MYNREGSPTITASIFSHNSSGAMGGGMFNIEGATPTISDCLFTQNSSNKGGGMRNYLNSHATVTDSVFSYNIAGEEGGGMDNRKNSNVLVISCKFIGNEAASGGGGMHNYVGRAVATGNPTIINGLFIGNSAPSGSAMRNNDPSPRIINSTFAYNINGAAIRSRNGSVPVLINSIVWGNPGGSLSWANAGSMPFATYSDIEGGHPGAGNVDSDPLFVSITGPDGNPATLDDNDYHLGPASPVINAGTNAVHDLPATDLDGNPRIAGGTADMGLMSSEPRVPPPPTATTRTIARLTAVRTGFAGIRLCVTTKTLARWTPAMPLQRVPSTPSSAAMAMPVPSTVATPPAAA